MCVCVCVCVFVYVCVCVLLYVYRDRDRHKVGWLTESRREGGREGGWGARERDIERDIHTYRLTDVRQRDSDVVRLEARLHRTYMR